MGNQASAPAPAGFTSDNNYHGGAGFHDDANSNNRTDRRGVATALQQALAAQWPATGTVINPGFLESVALAAYASHSPRAISHQQPSQLAQQQLANNRSSAQADVRLLQMLEQQILLQQQQQSCAAPLLQQVERQRQLANQLLQAVSLTTLLTGALGSSNHLTPQQQQRPQQGLQPPPFSSRNHHLQYRQDLSPEARMAKTTTTQQQQQSRTSQLTAQQIQELQLQLRDWQQYQQQHATARIPSTPVASLGVASPALRTNQDQDMVLSSAAAVRDAINAIAEALRAASVARTAVASSTAAATTSSHAAQLSPQHLQTLQLLLSLQQVTAESSAQKSLLETALATSEAAQCLTALESLAVTATRYQEESPLPILFDTEPDAPQKKTWDKRDGTYSGSSEKDAIELDEESDHEVNNEDASPPSAKPIETVPKDATTTRSTKDKSEKIHQALRSDSTENLFVPSIETRKTTIEKMGKAPMATVFTNSNDKINQETSFGENRSSATNEKTKNSRISGSETQPLEGSNIQPSDTKSVTAHENGTNITFGNSMIKENLEKSDLVTAKDFERDESLAVASSGDSSSSLSSSSTNAAVTDSSTKIGSLSLQQRKPCERGGKESSKIRAEKRGQTLVTTRQGGRVCLSDVDEGSPPYKIQRLDTKSHSIVGAQVCDAEIDDNSAIDPAEAFGITKPVAKRGISCTSANSHEDSKIHAVADALAEEPNLSPIEENGNDVECAVDAHETRSKKPRLSEEATGLVRAVENPILSPNSPVPTTSPPHDLKASSFSLDCAAKAAILAEPEPRPQDAWFRQEIRMLILFVATIGTKWKAMARLFLKRRSHPQIKNKFFNALRKYQREVQSFNPLRDPWNEEGLLRIENIDMLVFIQSLLYKRVFDGQDMTEKDVSFAEMLVHEILLLRKELENFKFKSDDREEFAPRLRAHLTSFLEPDPAARKKFSTEASNDSDIVESKLANVQRRKHRSDKPEGVSPNMNIHACMPSEPDVCDHSEPQRNYRTQELLEVKNAQPPSFPTGAIALEQHADVSNSAESSIAARPRRTRARLESASVLDPVMHSATPADMVTPFVGVADKSHTTTSLDSGDNARIVWTNDETRVLIQFAASIGVNRDSCTFIQEFVLHKSVDDIDQKFWSMVKAYQGNNSTGSSLVQGEAHFDKLGRWEPSRKDLQRFFDRNSNLCERILLEIQKLRTEMAASAGKDQSSSAALQSKLDIFKLHEARKKSFNPKLSEADNDMRITILFLSTIGPRWTTLINDIFANRSVGNIRKRFNYTIRRPSKKSTGGGKEDILTNMGRLNDCVDLTLFFTAAGYVSGDPTFKTEMDEIEKLRSHVAKVRRECDDDERKMLVRLSAVFRTHECKRRKRLALCASSFSDNNLATRSEDSLGILPAAKDTAAAGKVAQADPPPENKELKGCDQIVVVKIFLLDGGIEMGQQRQVGFLSVPKQVKTTFAQLRALIQEDLDLFDDKNWVFLSPVDNFATEGQIDRRRIMGSKDEESTAVHDPVALCCENASPTTDPKISFVTILSRN